WYFAVLAPTSSVLPLVGQTVAEHRMYLPFAAVVTLLVLGLCRAGAGIQKSGGKRHGSGFWILNSVFCLLAVVLGLLTSRRNGDYRSEVALWRDTGAKRPDNARADDPPGTALFRHGQAP